MSAGGTYLGLDVSGACTGVCFGRVGEKPTFLSKQFILDHDKASMDGIARASARAMLWAVEFFKVQKIDEVVIEAPIPDSRKNTNAWSSWQTAGLLFPLAGVCDLKSIPVHMVNIGRVRSHFLGRGFGNAPGKYAKPMVMRICKAAGWEPKNYDEADAGACWHWIGAQRHPQLFQRVDTISLGIPPLERPERRPKKGDVRLAPRSFRPPSDEVEF